MQDPAKWLAGHARRTSLVLPVRANARADAEYAKRRG